MLFKAFQGQGKKTSLAFYSEFREEDRGASVSLVFFSCKDSVLYKWSLSPVCVECYLVLRVAARLSRVTYIPTGMRKVTSIEMKATAHQHATERNNVKEHVPVQHTWKVWH